MQFNRKRFTRWKLKRICACRHFGIHTDHNGSYYHTVRNLSQSLPSGIPELMIPQYLDSSLLQKECIQLHFQYSQNESLLSAHDNILTYFGRSSIEIFKCLYIAGGLKTVIYLYRCSKRFVSEFFIGWIRLEIYNHFFLPFSSIILISTFSTIYPSMRSNTPRSRYFSIFPFTSHSPGREKADSICIGSKTFFSSPNCQNFIHYPRSQICWISLLKKFRMPL